MTAAEIAQCEVDGHVWRLTELDKLRKKATKRIKVESIYEKWLIILRIGKY